MLLLLSCRFVFFYPYAIKKYYIYYYYDVFKNGIYCIYLYRYYRRKLFTINPVRTMVFCPYNKKRHYFYIRFFLNVIIVSIIYNRQSSISYFLVTLVRL